jgi:curved DNA-binding protein CbpA
VLGVSRDADSRAIKAKYKDLVKRYHPDVYVGGDPAVFARIQTAYKVLVSPRSRLEYDRSLADAGSPRSEAGPSDDYKSKASASDFYRDLNSTGANRNTDLAAEHSKFFNEKIKTDFGQTVVQEDISISGMNDADRARAAFVAEKDEHWAAKAMKGKKRGFDAASEEAIEILNEDTTPKRKARLLGMAVQKGLRIGIMRLLLGFTVFGIVAGLTLSWQIRLSLKKSTEMCEKTLDQLEREEKSRQLRQQMVFD